jgi:hypothetical protein
LLRKKQLKRNSIFDFDEEFELSHLLTGETAFFVCSSGPGIKTGRLTITAHFLPALILHDDVTGMRYGETD